VTLYDYILIAIGSAALVLMAKHRYQAWQELVRECTRRRYGQ
jgi:hypothetical protein